MRWNAMLSVLVAGIAAQLLILAGRSYFTATSRTPRAAAQIGDTLSSLGGLDAKGAQRTIALTADHRIGTVLYVFHPDCAHSDKVAPAWGAHFAEELGDTNVRRIAVTSDSPDAAAQYAAQFGWQVELLSLASPVHRDQMRSLTSRTPWLFVFDSRGVLRLQAHGSELEQLAQLPEIVGQPVPFPLRGFR